MRIAASALLLFALAASVAAEGPDGYKREGKPAERKLRDSLEGKPPPALHARDWMNTGGKTPEFKDLKGKVVAVQVWAVW